MMREIQAEIRIRASREKTWNALVTSPSLPGEIRQAIRDRNTGHFLSVPMSTGSRNATLHVKILAIDPFREIRWQGYLWIPGLFDGEHSFALSNDPGGITRLVQRETFTGLFVPFLSGTLEDTKQAFETMNSGIRDAAERDA